MAEISQNMSFYGVKIVNLGVYEMCSCCTHSITIDVLSVVYQCDHQLVSFHYHLEFWKYPYPNSSYWDKRVPKQGKVKIRFIMKIHKKSAIWQLNEVFAGWNVLHYGFWAWENWFWHPFDDSKVLWDPNTTNGGLGDPPRLPQNPSWSVFQDLLCSYCSINQFIRVFGHEETDSDIHLMIQKFCVTLILQIGVSETPWGCLKTPLGPYFSIYCVPIVLWISSLGSLGMRKLILTSIWWFKRSVWP